ncbi:MAG: hypothetical protein FWC24_04550 [Treponema sp.]|nr:hypothetical protein [Treponema sp.]
MLACDDGNSNGDNGTDQLNGTWTAGQYEWTFNNGSYELKENGKLDEKGTYTTFTGRSASPSKGTIKLMPTHIHGDTWFSDELDSKWYSKSDLKKLGISDAYLDTIFEAEEKDYEVNNNSLTLDGTKYDKTSGGSSGGGSGSNGKLTITGLPNGGTYVVYVLESGTDISTLLGVTQGMVYNQIASGVKSSGNVFSLYNDSLAAFTATGSRPVVLHDMDGDMFSTTNPMYRRATVNFTNGGATVSFSSFTAVTSYTGGGGGDETSTWKTVTNTTFGNNFINCVAYGNGKFVAGGTYGKMAYSADGINWTAIPAGTGPGKTQFTEGYYGAGNIKDIMWYKDKFIASGDYVDYAYSLDGINWIKIEIGANVLACGNNMYLAGGLNGGIYYSSDGITWNSAISPLKNSIQGIAYGNGKFIAVGSSGEMMQSADGKNWSLVTTFNIPGLSDGDYANTISGIAYGSNKFIVAGYDKMAYSADGVTWTASTYGSGVDNIQDILWVNDRFFAMKTQKLYQSMNGTSWTDITDSTLKSMLYIKDIAYGNNKYVAVSYDEIAYGNP